MSLDERYGRAPARDRRRLLTVLLGAFVLVAVVWAVWSLAVLGRTTLRWGTTAVDTGDPAAARVSFQVSGGVAGPVVCSVRATDAGGVVVGWTDVQTRSGDPGGTTATVRTSRPAADGSVVSCVRR